MRKRTLLIAGRVVISFVLIVVILWRVDFSQTWKIILTSNTYYILLATLIAFASGWLCALRWQLLLVTLVGDIPINSLIKLTFVGYFYSLFFPTNYGGDVIKGIRLTGKIKKGLEITASILMDRLTGLIGSILVGLVCFIMVENLPLLLFILALIFFIMIVILNKGWRERVNQSKIEKPRFLGSILTPFMTYKGRSPVLIKALFYSLLIQLLLIISTYLICLSLNIKISFLNFAWINVATLVIQLVPISISGIGVREGTFIFFLSKYGIAAPESFSLSLIAFSITVLMGLTGGMIELLSSLFKYSANQNKP